MIATLTATRTPAIGETIVPTRDPDTIVQCDGCLEEMRWGDAIVDHDRLPGWYCSEDCMTQAIEDGAEAYAMTKAWY